MKVVLDPLDSFYHHNKPLYDKMIADGNILVHENGYQKFVDKDNNYVDYPVGYVTGPMFENRSIPYPHYVSIKSENGWVQRSFRTFSECVDWAKSYIKEHFNV